MFCLAGPHNRVNAEAPEPFGLQLRDAAQTEITLHQRARVPEDWGLWNAFENLELLWHHLPKCRRPVIPALGALLKLFLASSADMLMMTSASDFSLHS